MDVLATASTASRQALANPVRLLWVGGLPLVVALAVELLVVQPLMERVFWPHFDPASAHISVRLLVDPQVFGLKPLGPIFWFLRDLPWILFAAIFLFRWNHLALSDWRIGSLFGAAWPVLNGRALLLVSAAALSACYAAGIVDWVARGFQQALPEDHLVLLEEGLWYMGGVKLPPEMVDGMLIRMLQPHIDRARYLSEIRTISQILVFPVGALVLARFGLVVPARAAGRPLTLAESWRLTREDHVKLLLSYLVVAGAALVFFAGVSWAITLIPDPAEPTLRLGLFGWGSSTEAANPGALEGVLLIVAKALAIAGAAGCIAALVASSYCQIMSRQPPAPDGVASDSA